VKELLGLSPRPRIVTACCGAGWHLTSTLMGTPGASEYLVGSYLPYDGDETAAFLGFRPDKFVSEETAIHLATEAFMRATLRSGNGDRPIGIGVTASIASLQVHRGAHEYFVAAVTHDKVFARHAILGKGVGYDVRDFDDSACESTVVDLLQMRVASQEPLSGDEECRERSNGKLARELFLSRRFFTPEGRERDIAPDTILFPGAFNPLHEGHQRIADAVFRQTGRPVVYAITADSPHKPALTFQEMARRAALIRQDSAVLFSEGDPLYIDKARRWQGKHFIIGVDALERMLDPKWGPAVEPMLDEFRSLWTHFFVAPRIVDGSARGLADIVDRIPKAHRRLFSAVKVAPSEISSSAIRAQKVAQ
jgi:nicotinic acid mononucleotide adenylyltransferase